MMMCRVCVVRIFGLITALMSFISVLGAEIAPLNAQDYRPFSEEGEAALRRNLDQFLNRQQQNQSLEDQRDQEDAGNSLIDANSRGQQLNNSELRQRGSIIGDQEEGTEFSDDPFGPRRGQPEDRFEARGGDDRPLDVDIERAVRRQQQQLNARFEVRGETQVGERQNNADEGTAIDPDEIAALEGDEQDTGEDGENQFEEEFLAAERTLENDDQNNQGDLRNADRGNQRNLARQGNNNQRGANDPRFRDNQQAAIGDDLENGDLNDITGSIRPNAPEDIYAQDGKRIGAFLLFPEITISVLHNDNPTASPENGPGDNAIEILPRFLLRSDWSRHELTFEGQIEKGYFEELTSENIDEWFLAFGTRIDIQNNHFLQIDGRIENEQDNRGDLDDDSTDAELATEERLSLTALYNYEWNRVTLQLGAGIENNDVEDTVDSNGVETNNDDEDYQEISSSIRLSYTLHPGLFLYSEGRYIERDYDQVRDDAGFARSSDSYAVEVGGIYDISSLLRLQTSIGYHWQEADDNRLDKIDELIYSALLTYRASEKTTLTFNTGRTIETTDLDGTVAFVETTYGANLTHYFRPHIRLTAGLAFEQEDYQGVDVEQETLTASLTLQYIFNRHARLLASYEYNDVDDNDGGNYQENEFRLGLILRP